MYFNFNTENPILKEFFLPYPFFFDSPLKTMKNAFYYIQFCVFLSFPLFLPSAIALEDD